MNYLQLKEYLGVTNDEYAIVKLTEKSKEVLEEEEPVVMKMAKEQEHPAKVKSEKGKKSRKGLAAGLGGAQFTEREEALFEKLRTLRAEIAKEEKVPPYIVFSDKTLTHMCICLLYTSILQVKQLVCRPSTIKQPGVLKKRLSLSNRTAAAGNRG